MINLRKNIAKIEGRSLKLIKYETLDDNKHK